MPSSQPTARLSKEIPGIKTWESESLVRFTHTIYGILSLAVYYPHIPKDELLYTLFTLTFTKNMQLVEKKMKVLYSPIISNLLFLIGIHKIGRWASTPLSALIASCKTGHG